jgi:hypothetical protein
MIISVITYHLEQKLQPCVSIFDLLCLQSHISVRPERHIFFEAIQAVLARCHPLQSPIASARLAKAVLPSITTVLAERPHPQRGDSASGNKKAKKRARGFEGDEVFKISREVVFPTAEDGNVALAALGGQSLHNVSTLTG